MNPTLCARFCSRRGFYVYRLGQNPESHTLTSIIHERFCCNRRFTAATGLRPAGSPLGSSTYCTSTLRVLPAPRAGLAT